MSEDLPSLKTSNWTTMINWNAAIRAPQNYLTFDVYGVRALYIVHGWKTKIRNISKYVLRTVNHRSIHFTCFWHATISWVRMPSCTHLPIPPSATKYIHLSQLTKSKYSLPFRPTTRFDELLPVAVDISEYSITAPPPPPTSRRSRDVRWAKDSYNYDNNFNRNKKKEWT